MSSIDKVKEAADKAKEKALSLFSSVASAMKKATKNDEVLSIGEHKVILRDKLGEGGYAYVFSCEDERTGDVYALKRMLGQDEDSKTMAEKEINITKMIGHEPNIVRFIGATRKDAGRSATEYYLLMELCSGGSLIDFIKRQNYVKLGERTIQDIFTQVCNAVAVLHRQNPPIAHRDLKVENILLSRDGTWKLCDFGSCTTRAQVYATQDEIVPEEERIQKYTTPMYRAPEMADLYSRQLVNEKVDIWALGCILYTLAFYTHPFQEGSNLQIMSGNFDMPEDHPFSNYLVALIKRLLTVQPTKRPPIDRVREMLQQWKIWLDGEGKTWKKPKAKPKEEKPMKTPSLSATAAALADKPEKAEKKKKKHREAGANSEQKANASLAAAFAVVADDWAPDWNAFPDAGPAGAGAGATPAATPSAGRGGAGFTPAGVPPPQQPTAAMRQNAAQSRSLLSSKLSSDADEDDDGEEGAGEEGFGFEGEGEEGSEGGGFRAGGLLSRGRDDSSERDSVSALPSSSSSSAPSSVRPPSRAADDSGVRPASGHKGRPPSASPPTQPPRHPAPAAATAASDVFGDPDDFVSSATATAQQALAGSPAPLSAAGSNSRPSSRPRSDTPPTVTSVPSIKVSTSASSASPAANVPPSPNVNGLFNSFSWHEDPSSPITPMSAHSTHSDKAPAPAPGAAAATKPNSDVDFGTFSWGASWDEDSKAKSGGRSITPNTPTPSTPSGKRDPYGIGVDAGGVARSGSGNILGAGSTNAGAQGKRATIATSTASSSSSSSTPRGGPMSPAPAWMAKPKELGDLGLGSVTAMHGALGGKKK